jgi:hypothetical protein
MFTLTTRSLQRRQTQAGQKQLIDTFGSQSGKTDGGLAQLYSRKSFAPTRIYAEFSRVVFSKG